MAAVAPRGGVAEELSRGAGGGYFLEAIVTPGGGAENFVRRVNGPPPLLTDLNACTFFTCSCYFVCYIVENVNLAFNNTDPDISALIESLSKLLRATAESYIAPYP